MNTTEDLPLLKIVGVSASGKSTLVNALRARGYNARPVSQEHSNVPGLWRQFDRPQILIFLDVSYEKQCARRPEVGWTPAWYRTELARLHNARSNADLKIDTSDLNPEQVQEISLIFLTHRRVAHADHPLPPLAATGSSQK